MEDSQLFDITFESFQKLTIVKKEEILQLAIEQEIKKQQELYPVLSCIRNYCLIKQLFESLKHLNTTLRQIVMKFSQVKMSSSHVAAQKLPSIYAIEQLAIDIFDLLEMSLDAIVLHNKVHDHTSLDRMYKVLKIISKISDSLKSIYE